MSIKLGSNTRLFGGQLKLGSLNVRKVYLGNVKIFPTINKSPNYFTLGICGFTLDG